MPPNRIEVFYRIYDIDDCGSLLTRIYVEEKDLNKTVLNLCFNHLGNTLFRSSVDQLWHRIGITDFIVRHNQITSLRIICHRVLMPKTR